MTTSYHIFAPASNLGPTSKSQICPQNQSHKMAHFQLAQPISSFFMHTISNQGTPEALTLFFHYKAFPFTFLPSRLCQMQAMVDILRKQPLFVFIWVIFVYFHTRFWLPEKAQRGHFSYHRRCNCRKQLLVLGLGEQREEVKIIKRQKLGERAFHINPG